MRENENPKVEILMATYNGELYIREQIESIINQSYNNWVLKIKDDKSSDGTVEILQEYARAYPEKIQVYISEVPTGSAKENFFDLLRLSQGSYIMCCDQDDIWNNDKIEISLKRLIELEENENSIVLVHTDLIVVDQEGCEIADSFEKYSKLNCLRNKINMLLVENVVTGCTMMFNRNLLNKALLVSDISGIKMHDYWLALVATVFGKIDYIDIATMNYRQHQNNSVGAQNVGSISKILNKLMDKREVIKAIDENKRQAKIFYETYQDMLCGQNLEIINAFNLIDQKNKICRIATMIKYKFYRNYIFKRIALVLWI